MSAVRFCPRPPFYTVERCFLTLSPTESNGWPILSGNTDLPADASGFLLASTPALSCCHYVFGNRLRHRHAFYLTLTRDWNKRLLVDGDIFSFGVWMHFGLIITLFVLYAFQIHAGLKLLKSTSNNKTVKREHRMQAKGILLARALVIITGAILFEPTNVS